MTNDPLATLIAKEAIRELVLLYSRGVDRQDFDLLRSLYTEDGIDSHGMEFSGDKEAYVAFLESTLPNLKFCGHYVCNHLISVDGDEGEGEVYCLAYHSIPDDQGGFQEDFIALRYIDNYRREADGLWRFAKRLVHFDYRTGQPIPATAADGRPSLESEASLTMLTHRLFKRGTRA